MNTGGFEDRAVGALLGVGGTFVVSARARPSRSLGLVLQSFDLSKGSCQGVGGMVTCLVTSRRYVGRERTGGCAERRRRWTVCSVGSAMGRFRR